MRDEHGPIFGQLSDEGDGRDAIHIACIAVQAGKDIHRGDRVKIENGRAVCARPKDSIGVVDPWLRRNPSEGEWIWLLVNPRTITSLRHDWGHPAFPASNGMGTVTPQTQSKRWLTQYAEIFGLSYGALVDAARTYVETESDDWTEHHVLDYDTPDEAFEMCEEMWRHLNISEGLRPKNTALTFFTCSC